MTELFNLVVFAEGGATPTTGGVDMLGAFVPIILMFVVFYFILIRPQRKREKNLKDMIAALKIGDEVVTVGGIHGKITKIKDETFVIESGIGNNKSSMRVDRSAVARVTKSASDDSRYAPPEEDETKTDAE